MNREESLLAVAEIVNGWPEAQPLTDAEMESHAAAIVDMDYAATLAGIRHLTRTFKVRPSVHELREAIEGQTSRPPSREDLIPLAKPPRWVFVWSWARWDRAPTERRTLPQQGGWDFTADEEKLSRATYAELEQEWVAAGAPERVKLLAGVSL